MSLNTAEKQKLIETHQVHATDTGSVEVQVAMLSKRISKLSDHLQDNIHDFSSFYFVPFFLIAFFSLIEIIL